MLNLMSKEINVNVFIETRMSYTITSRVENAGGCQVCKHIQVLGIMIIARSHYPQASFSFPQLLFLGPTPLSSTQCPYSDLA